MPKEVGAEFDLEKNRNRISEITDEIVGLLSERAEVSLAIGRNKIENGTKQIRDLDREQAVIAGVIEINAGPLSNAALGRIVQNMMNETSLLQSKESGLPLGVPLDQGPGFDISEE